MHDWAPPPGGGGTVPQGQRFHQSGPWLIICGRDSKSRAAAGYIAELCGARGVSWERMAADDEPPRAIGFFVGLIIVLPADPTGEGAQSIGRISDHIRAYRARRLYGLDDLRRGEQWYAVGVIQVFDLVNGDAIAELGSVRRAVCRLWMVPPGEAPTPFEVYDSIDGPDAPAKATDGHADDVGDTSWHIVLSWGVEPSTDQVAAVRRFIDALRDRWEDTRYPVLYRPVSGMGMNRFDFVLDEPPTFRPDLNGRPWRKWKEDGQRTVNSALEALAEAFPNVRRPAKRAGKRDLQRDFYEFYQALCTVDDRSRRTTR